MSKRSLTVGLAVIAVAGGLMWFTLHGAGTVSADGGLDAGSQGGNVSQQYDQNANIGTCLLPGIPC